MKSTRSLNLMISLLTSAAVFIVGTGICQAATPAIAAGHSHTIALAGDDSLWAWGYNQYGQVGDGTVVDRLSPVQIDTGTKPIVTTQAVTGIGSITAIGNGNIINLGSPNPTQHGVCWNTTGTPTTADSKTEEGAAITTGAFSSNMTGLSPNTTYYVRAYATNTAGPSYGSDLTFTTTDIYAIY
ncbi:MAG: hypothetical protein KAT81_02930, partial [Syntrophobacterales bacterium]|nr:hypothetical protein [Syntrophobacterales bacterium]